MWLIGSTFEIESCGCSQFQEEKILTLGGNGLSQAYLVGSVSGREKEMNLANRKTLRMQKNPLKCSQKTLLWELSARVRFRSSLPEIFPRAEKSLRTLHKTRLQNNGSHRLFAWQLWEKLLLLSRGEYYVKCHIKPPEDLFVLPHTCDVLHHVKDTYCISYLHKPKSTPVNDYEHIIKRHLQTNFKLQS